MTGKIHIGVGGWDFDPWRGTFYPEGLAKAKQLEYTASKLSATEINATYYKLQSPALFQRWAKAVPVGFSFALKASRYATNRKNLAEAAESIGRFCAQGFTELGDKLGPILWQLANTKRFDPDEIRDFLALLPARQDGVPLRHAIEPRHESFRDRAFVAMARALLRDPDLPNKLAAEDTDHGLCVHCNKCMATIFTGTRCVLVPEEQR